jgi:hypothetical protein
MRRLLLLMSVMTLGVSTFILAPAPFGGSQAMAQSLESCIEISTDQVSIASFAPNCEKRRITVIKEVEGDSDVSFDFDAAGSGAFHDESFSLMDGESEELIIPADTYTVTEFVPDGWILTAIECRDEDAVLEIDLENGQVTLDMNLDPHVVCTFHNAPVAVEEDKDADEDLVVVPSSPNLGGFFAGLVMFLFGGGGE